MSAGEIIPRFMSGGFTGEAIDGRQTDGRYLHFEWLRFVFIIEFGAMPKRGRR